MSVMVGGRRKVARVSPFIVMYPLPWLLGGARDSVRKSDDGSVNILIEEIP